MAGSQGWGLPQSAPCRHAGQHRFAVGDKARRAVGVKPDWLRAHDPWGTEAVKSTPSGRPILVPAPCLHTSVFGEGDFGTWSGALDPVL